MQIDKTYMPRYLDEPYKIAYFTIDEVRCKCCQMVSDEFG